MDIFPFTNKVNIKMVDYFWDAENDRYWRKWKQKQHWQNALETQQWGNIEKELQSRKAHIVTGNDIL